MALSQASASARRESGHEGQNQLSLSMTNQAWAKAKQVRRLFWSRILWRARTSGQCSTDDNARATAADGRYYNPRGTVGHQTLAVLAVTHAWLQNAENTSHVSYVP